MGLFSKGGTTLPPGGTAEQWFRRAVSLCREGRYHEALDPIEHALAAAVLEQDDRFLRRLRSSYGMVIALARGDLGRGRRLCEEAITDGPFDADLYTNLARVYVAGERKDLAVEALLTALAVDPACASARSLMGALGWRRTPVFPFLSRGNPVNRIAGKIRHRLARRPPLPSPPPAV